MMRTPEQQAVKYRQITPTEGQCGAWWKSLNHFDYLHRCTLDPGHDEACTCACGALPGPRGVMKRPQPTAGDRADGSTT